MTPTDYLRQVPIKRWLPKTFKNHKGVTLSDDPCEEVITGYKTQMAWFCGYLTKGQAFSESERTALERGLEVEAFEWIDLPIVEGV